MSDIKESFYNKLDVIREELKSSTQREYKIKSLRQVKKLEKKQNKNQILSADEMRKLSNRKKGLQRVNDNLI